MKGEAGALSATPFLIQGGPYKKSQIRLGGAVGPSARDPISRPPARKITPLPERGAGGMAAPTETNLKNEGCPTRRVRAMPRRGPKLAFIQKLALIVAGKKSPTRNRKKTPWNDENAAGRRPGRHP